METTELNRIADRLQVLERQELFDAGLKNINGGFAIIDMYSFDDRFIYVEIMHGIQCGGDDDYTHTENAKLHRESLEWA